ncbi:solute carrier family 23 protein [Shigella flexneri]
MAWFLGMLPKTPRNERPPDYRSNAAVLRPLGIDWSLLLPLMLVFMITSLETIGDITATSDVSEQPVSPVYLKRLKGGVLATA